MKSVDDNLLSRLYLKDTAFQDLMQNNTKKIMVSESETHLIIP